MIVGAGGLIAPVGVGILAVCPLATLGGWGAAADGTLGRLGTVGAAAGASMEILAVSALAALGGWGAEGMAGLASDGGLGKPGATGTETDGTLGRLGTAGFTTVAAAAESEVTSEAAGFGTEIPLGAPNGEGTLGGFGTLIPGEVVDGIPGTEGGLTPNAGADGDLMADGDPGGLIAAKDGTVGVIPVAGGVGTEGVVTGTGLGGKFNLGPTSELGDVGLLV